MPVDLSELTPEQIAQLPEVPDDQFPAAVVSEDDKVRWRLALGIASAMFPDDNATIWQATRSIYEGEIET